ncbi:hypothetical protein RN001_010449 [Aquatica leii]|uniref:TLC domain-containing protein n=1 Tax=Aquatica leii TaxID=1421715 RepID=A0AAN7P7X2_9COLE|nr:hypothetical protein RN001_010449 [Aquatica leii]
MEGKDQLRSKFDNLKKETRRYFAKQRQDLYRTGGGVVEDNIRAILKLLYNKIRCIINLSVLGLEAFPGDSDMIATDIATDNIVSDIGTTETASAAEMVEIPPAAAECSSKTVDIIEDIPVILNMYPEDVNSDVIGNIRGRKNYNLKENCNYRYLVLITFPTNRLDDKQLNLIVIVRPRRMFGFSLFSENVWLPNNLTWKDLETVTAKEDIPHLALALPFSLLMLIVRYSFEKFCFAPIGRSLKVKSVRVKSPYNAVLEKAFLLHKQYDYKQVRWAKQLDWSERQVERWLKIRARENKPTTLNKLCESCWRFTYYFTVFVLGLTVLWDKPWLWNIKECWRTYPYQARTIGVYLHYFFSLAFYFSLFLTQFFDVKLFSWSARLYRIGTLILLVHDFADVFLEAAKITKYCGLKKTCEIVFGVFTLCWCFSRIIAFPFWILKSTLFDVLEYNALYPGYFIFNLFLITLLLLNVLWTYLLFKLIFKVIKAKEMLDDIRSSTESDDD